MKPEKAYELIVKLASAKPSHKDDYYIDFVPITFPNEDYSELADYLEKNYKSDFANKIVFIAFTILYYYDSQVFIDKWDKDTDPRSLTYLKKNKYTKPIYPDLVFKDIRHVGLNAIATLIKMMVMENSKGINILFKNDGKTSLMSIEDEYSTYFYNLTGKGLEIIDKLVEHQGLFLKKNTYSDSDFVF